MTDREKKEEQNKRIGWLTSVTVQLVLLVLFYFIVAWREPFPPIPEYGIELGFSSSAGGPAAAAPSVPTTAIEEEVTEEVQETEAEQNTPEETSTEAQEATSETEPVEPVETEVVETETPVEVEQAIEESTPTEEVVEGSGQPEEVVEEVTETVDERAVMTSGSQTEGEKVNENPADGENEEEKELDQRAIYGSQGSNTGDAEGANLSLSGWIWDFKPKPKDTSDETGKIVYKIVVDADGYLIKIETVTSTVSPTVERKYRQEVEKLTFSKTADYKTAPVSTGTITFIIKTK